MTERTAWRKTARDRARPVAPAPDRAALRAAALAHLARFGTTSAGLRQVLERQVQRWGRRAASAGLPSEDVAAQLARALDDIAPVVRDMADLGAVDDAAFAQSRARSLTRTGRSRRAVEAHLAARGVAGDLAETVLDDALGARGGAGGDTELAAALVFARRRRAGPFAPPCDAEPAGEAESGQAAEAAARRRRLVLEAMARAGFGRAVAEAALDMDPAEAEDRIIRMKSA